MTCRPVPQASKWKKPQERCQKASAGRRPSLVKLRSGDKAMRGWAQVQRIWARGLRGKPSKSALARGKGHGGSAQPIRHYRAYYQDSVGHSDHKGVGFRGGDVALAAGERPIPLEGTTNSK
jgi:hypothetical protein